MLRSCQGPFTRPSSEAALALQQWKVGSLSERNPGSVGGKSAVGIYLDVRESEFFFSD